ncbi:hypothetical protein RJ639_042599 [Escallonia herrerae]|uniref:Uncharacterized protein n=1 Tax=Escallonia herrerae TaxID=1293975 RepID=A0AA88WHK3_9ASTE|nr:hypothetical protein RJ639_042599 [Escallonia herrerae]
MDLPDHYSLQKVSSSTGRSQKTDPRNSIPVWNDLEEVRTSAEKRLEEFRLTAESDLEDVEACARYEVKERDCILKEVIAGSVVPMSLVNLGSLKVVNLTNNLLQGPMSGFNCSVVMDLVKETNSFCLSTLGECDPRVNTLLPVVKSMDYPASFVDK